MKKKVGISMRISTLGYVGKQGIKNIGRNKMFSFASVATMSACIFLFGLFFSIIVNFQHIIKSAEEGVAVTVFFDAGLPQETKDNIGAQLKKREEVGKVVFVSADEAWEQYKKQYFADNPDAAQGFKNDNPLAESDHYEVYMKTENKDKASLSVRSKSLALTQKDLVKYAKDLEGVRDVRKSDVVAKALSSVNTLVGYVSVAIILILFGVSIFLISNTVTMGITVRKEEIAIMKYIGAKDFVVRSPFIIESILMGIVGAIIPLALLYALYGKAVSYVLTHFTILNNIIDFLPVSEVYRWLLPTGLILGVGMGFFGSFFTVRKHLKV